MGRMRQFPSPLRGGVGEGCSAASLSWRTGICLSPSRNTLDMLCETPLRPSSPPRARKSLFAYPAKSPPVLPSAIWISAQSAACTSQTGFSSAIRAAIFSLRRVPEIGGEQRVVAGVVEQRFDGEIGEVPHRIVHAGIFPIDQPDPLARIEQVPPGRIAVARLRGGIGCAVERASICLRPFGSRPVAARMADVPSRVSAAA